MNKAKLEQLIHESNLIENIDNPREDEQSLIAWNWLYDWNMPLTHSAICRVQKIITLNQADLMPNQQGHYRSMSKTNVMIGGHWAPMWHRVEGLMDNWLLDFGDPKQEFDPIQAHIRFENVHPLSDGNGRTGRLILWWHQLKKGGEPTLFIAREKYEKYYLLFR